MASQPKAVAILRKTTYDVERPEGQNSLGHADVPEACSYDEYDFRIDTHRKDMVSRIARTLMRTYGLDSVADIMRTELEGVLKALEPSDIQ